MCLVRYIINSPSNPLEMQRYNIDQLKEHALHFKCPQVD